MLHIFSAFLVTTHRPLTSSHSISCRFSLSSVRPPIHASPSSSSPSMSVCQSLFGSLRSYLGCIFISLRYIPRSLIRSGYKERGRARRARGRWWEKGWTIGVKSIFPQNWFWSVWFCKHVCFLKRGHTVEN